MLSLCTADLAGRYCDLNTDIYIYVYVYIYIRRYPWLRPIGFPGRHLQEAINSWDESAATNVSNLASCLKIGFHKFMTPVHDQLFFFFGIRGTHLCSFFKRNTCGSMHIIYNQIARSKPNSTSLGLTTAGSLGFSSTKQNSSSCWVPH